MSQVEVSQSIIEIGYLPQRAITVPQFITEVGYFDSSKTVLTSQFMVEIAYIKPKDSGNLGPILQQIG